MKGLRAAAALGLATVFGVFALNEPAAAQIPLFTDETPIPITIDAPFDTLVRRARTSTETYPAQVSIGGIDRAFAIEINARGLSRRTRDDFCQFPPLRLDFPEREMRGTPFERQNRLKLVTYCRPPASYSERIVLEYLAYRLFNLVTDESFRVRATDVTYRDAEGRRSEITRFGFLIEDVDDVARRNGGRRELQIPTAIAVDRLDAEDAARYALFQFMIGNLDWSLVSGPDGEDCCHNTKLIAARDGSGAATPIPYDFDFSGLVDSPYATPPPNIAVNSVTTRYYRGYCRHNDALPGVIEDFRMRRQAMQDLIAAEQRLSPSRRRTAQAFIDGFFAVLDDPGRFDRSVIRRCR